MFKSIGALFRKIKESEDWRKVQEEDEERRRAWAEAGNVLDLDATGDSEENDSDDDLSLEDVESVLTEFDEKNNFFSLLPFTIPDFLLSMEHWDTGGWICRHPWYSTCREGRRGLRPKAGIFDMAVYARGRKSSVLSVS